MNAAFPGERPADHSAGPVSPPMIVKTTLAWAESLGGAISLQDGLRDLVFGLGAEAGLLVRTQLSDMRPVRLATVDRASGLSAIRPLTHSYADSHFGLSIERALSATCWVTSSHLGDCTDDPALPVWQSQRRLRDFVVLVLASEGGIRDHIELHFRDRLTAEGEAMLTAVLPELSRHWLARRVGLITRTVINHRSPAHRPQAAARGPSILSVENPAHLSRAEFRVCLHLSRGLLVQAVAQELSLSEPTIRTHLRNIYAKTECSCLAELVYRLMDSRSEMTVAEARSA